MAEERRYDISMHHIPIKGGIGVALFIALLVTVMLIELPQLRWPTLGSIVAGILLGAGLILWRRRAR
jgi:L-asparagine transporter-like permease